MFYVVTKGCYSDYHIIAVTTDKDVAEKIASKFEGEYGFDETQIEMYPDGAVMLKPLWVVYFDNHGNVYKCDPGDEYDYKHTGEIVTLYGGRLEFRIYVNADTQEAAIKIAAEKRAQYLAEKNGL